LDKNVFSTDTMYSVTLRDEQGKLRPANIYVYRLYDDYMIARMTDKGGMLLKIKYDDVTKIVKTISVADPKKFMLPEAVLAQKTWETRNSMTTYSSAPGLGK
jgi:hypothetical protein